MTIKHIVLFPFKASLSKREIDTIMSSLGELKKSIPQILSFSWGENNSPENLHQGYLHGFIMEFKNESDRAIYLDHPLHVNWVKDVLRPTLEETRSPLVFDYTE